MTPEDQHREIMEALRAQNDVMKEAAREREEMRKIILGDPTDPTRPGFNTRLDRVERTMAAWQQRIAWIGGGGVLTAATSAALLWWIGQMLAAKLKVP